MNASPARETDGLLTQTLIVEVKLYESPEPIDPQPPLRRAIFTMLPFFMGYATMVTLQAHIKHRLDIGDNSSSASYAFSFATSLIYFGNLIFRLMHNIFFCFLAPRYRVVLAYSCMSVATATLGFAYYVANSKLLAWTYVAYLLAGVAVGTFESNLISCITPLGHQTKVWAQYGIPIGFSGISIGAFALFSVYPTNLDLQMGVYFGVAAANVAGLIFYLLAIPYVPFEATNQGIGAFWKDLKEFKNWALLILPYSLSLFVDMFAVSFFSAIQLFIYDIPHLPLYPGCEVKLSKEIFRVLFNLGSMLGDGSGRKLAYWTPKHIRPYLFLLLTGIGAGCILSKVTFLAPIGMMFVMHANGEVYAHTTKYVDDKVPRRYNLIALSFWLFVGDAGSFVGANVVNAVRVLIGGVSP